jgi:predicted dehydrogenase
MVEYEQLAVGLVGAGPWAWRSYAPMFAAGPETRLAGVWSRRWEAAEEIAAAHESVALRSYDELLESCEAVAFAVPPKVQSEFAALAAEAGKALLLEKPIADSLVAAEQLAEVVQSAGVPSLVAFTWRYASSVRAFLTSVAGITPQGGRAIFVSGSALHGPFATTWRLARGCLLDLGPHVIDLLDAALGPVMSVRAHGDPAQLVGLLLEHVNGLTSQAIISSSAASDTRAGAEVIAVSGIHEVDCAAEPLASTLATLRAEFAASARARAPHSMDINRGLHIQRLIAMAEVELGIGN